jgi:hypothetical protein
MQLLLTQEPGARKWIRPFMGAEEFINNIPRWCLWLTEITSDELKDLPEISKRVQAVKMMRTKSTDAQTKKDAATPMLFQKIRQPTSHYLLVPSVSSELRRYVPIGFIDPHVIVSNLVYSVPNATLYHFGILTSTMHNAWMRTTCGRLKSDYRYSNTIVYNNFPWPIPPKASKSNASKPTLPPSTADSTQAAIEYAAQNVLDARAEHPGKTLAWLYNRETMPANLQAAHATLDVAVDTAYGYKGNPDDASRVAFLFKAYQRLTTQATEQTP